MKKQNYITAIMAIFLMTTSQSFGQSVAISAAGVAPNPAAMLDVSSTTQGMLVPRMTVAQRNGIAGGNPPDGLLIYQTNGVAGFYYYNATTALWTALFAGPEPWYINGNTGTNPATQFLGPITGTGLAFRTNTVERARFRGSGEFGVGNTAPAEAMDVVGAIKIDGTSQTDDAGVIRWNPTISAHEGNLDGTATGWYRLENKLIERTNQTWELIVSSCTATVVQIGTGTTTTGTLQSPYGTLWEDGKNNLLYLASELLAQGMCPGDITALEFRIGTYSQQVCPMTNASLKIKSTTATALNDYEYTGWQVVWTGTHTPNTPGNWDLFTFSAPFYWNGTANVLVEYCYDRNEWIGCGGTSNLSADNMTFNANFGTFCDACGPAFPGLPGCDQYLGMSLQTIDGTLPLWNGGQGASIKRPIIRLHGQTGSLVVVPQLGDYMLSQEGIMVGDPAWAAIGAWPIPPGPAFSFNGPGTIRAENQVWAGGTILSDHVFDVYYDGALREEDKDDHPDYTQYSMDDMANYMERERHLPTIDGRDQWNSTGMFSVDALSSQLWETVEVQALYIQELKARMDLLEDHLLKKKLEEVLGKKGKKN